MAKLESFTVHFCRHFLCEKVCLSMLKKRGKEKFNRKSPRDLCNSTEENGCEVFILGTTVVEKSIKIAKVIRLFAKSSALIFTPEKSSHGEKDAQTKAHYELKNWDSFEAFKIHFRCSATLPKGDAFIFIFLLCIFTLFLDQLHQR